MRKLLIICLALTLLLAGCAQDVVPTEPQTPTDSGTTPSQNHKRDPIVTEPDVTLPTEGTESSTTPSNPEPDSTEESAATTPTEPSEGSQDTPRQVTADEIKTLMNNKFYFGDKGLLGKPAYVWYPQGIAEMQFKYDGTKYYARAYEGYADIACWNHPWIKPYGTSDDLPGLEGKVRRCKIDDVVYTSIFWYDESKGLTYTLDWTGGGEDYIYFVSIVFQDKLNDYVIEIPQ